jgi:hypothetical protein
MNKEIECVKCLKQYDWAEIDKVVDIAICPNCNSNDSFVETDGVSSDDYEQDNPREVPNE